VQREAAEGIAGSFCGFPSVCPFAFTACPFQMLTGGGTKADNLAPMLVGCQRITTSANVCGILTSDPALRFGKRYKCICEAHSAFSR